MKTENDVEEPIEEPVEDSLVGSIFAVTDDWWGFSAVGRDHHPGACVQELPAQRRVLMLKGTSAETKEKYRRDEIVVVATETNGLAKLTVFSVRPWPFRERKVRLLVANRLMGQLSETDLTRLRSEMIRQFGSQG